MAEKQIKSRIVHKHDSEVNWEKAVNFIPKKGELIIYDKDPTYDYQRIKIGDGATVVSSLPFVTEKITIDTALSSSSTNPVQNKVINAALTDAVFCDDALNTVDLPVMPIASGGTGASTATQARLNIGAAADSHTHNTIDIVGELSVNKGGTGATNAAQARVNLGVTAGNIGAATNRSLGCIIVGSGLDVDSNGVLSINDAVKTIWDNATPTSSFAAQTVSCDLSDAKYIEIDWGYSTGNIDNTCTTKMQFVSGNNMTVMFSYYVTSTTNVFGLVVRTATIVSGGIQFTIASQKRADVISSSSLATHAIPLRIRKVV